MDSLVISNIKIQAWNGRSFEVFHLQQAETQESLGAIAREYVETMGLKLIYWGKVQ